MHQTQMESFDPATGRNDLNKTMLLPTRTQVGSPNLPTFLEQHADLLKSDYAISADGGQIRCHAVGA